MGTSDESVKVVTTFYKTLDCLLYEDLMKRYIINILITFDQFVNVLFLGQPDETISSRAWRCKDANSFWGFMRKIIDTIFFWQKDHCYHSFIAKIERYQAATEILKRNK